jgi:hypothetical protein
MLIQSQRHYDLVFRVAVLEPDAGLIDELIDFARPW